MQHTPTELRTLAALYRVSAGEVVSEESRAWRTSLADYLENLAAAIEGKQELKAVSG